MNLPQAWSGNSLLSTAGFKVVVQGRAKQQAHNTLTPASPRDECVSRKSTWNDYCQDYILCVPSDCSGELFQQQSGHTCKKDKLGC